MAHTFVISEYKQQGHKQLLLERLIDEDSGYRTYYGYRVIIVKRCSSLDAAAEVFLREIPDGNKERYKKVIADYAAQHGVKTKKPKQDQIKPRPAPAKGKQNAKSQQKAD